MKSYLEYFQEYYEQRAPNALLDQENILGNYLADCLQFYNRKIKSSEIFLQKYLQSKNNHLKIYKIGDFIYQWEGKSHHKFYHNNKYISTIYHYGGLTLESFLILQNFSIEKEFNKALELQESIKQKFKIKEIEFHDSAIFKFFNFKNLYLYSTLEVEGSYKDLKVYFRAPWKELLEFSDLYCEEFLKEFSTIYKYVKTDLTLKIEYKNNSLKLINLY